MNKVWQTGFLALLVADCSSVGPETAGEPQFEGADGPRATNDSVRDSESGGSDSRPSPDDALIVRDSTAVNDILILPGDANVIQPDASVDLLVADTGPTDSALCVGPPLIEQCFFGLSFADCGGVEQASVYCTAEVHSASCIWAARDCAPVSFPRLCDRRDRPEDAPWRCGDEGALEQWGKDPWDRSRAMDLQVLVDSNLPGARSNLTCGPCHLIDGTPVPPGWQDNSCFESAICDPQARHGLQIERAPDHDWTPESGTARFSFTDVDAPTGRTVHVEIDLPRNRARVCAVPYNDAERPTPEPICATGGTVTLDRNLVWGPDLDVVHLRIEASFPSVAPTAGFAPYIEPFQMTIDI